MPKAPAAALGKGRSTEASGKLIKLVSHVPAWRTQAACGSGVPVGSG